MIAKLIADGQYVAACEALSAKPSIKPEEAAEIAILAARHGQRRILQLLDQGEYPLDKLSWNRTPLQVAALGGFADCIEFLISRGADIERRTPKGVSPLLLCARTFGEFNSPEEYVESIRLLLAAGAQTEVADDYGRTPLSYVCEKGLLAAVLLLLSQGANPRGSGTPLREAVVRGDIDIVNALLGAGANPDESDGAGFTPLMLACVFDRQECALRLLTAGAEISHTAIDGENVWSLCSAHNRDELKLRFEEFARRTDNPAE